MNEVLIAGLFRSGTTLLARILGSRPDALVVADPFVYLFKAYRNFLLERSGASGWHPDEPTSDLFRAPQHALWRELLLTRDLRETMPRHLLDKLRADLRLWKAEQHPRLCERLDELRPGTFAEVYRGLLELCLALYRPAGGVALVGGKVSWCEEFLPAMARAFPGLAFVILVRDLRAVVASQNERTGAACGKRPLLFYVRHWRKSVGLARRALLDPLLRERVLVLRYEDLIAQPAPLVRRLCEHVGLPFEPSMLDATGFRAPDERGAWRPNSSFEGGAGIYTDSLERWRTVLRREEIAALEALAGPELRLMGYELSLPSARPEACATSGCEPAFEELAEWIRPFGCAAYLRDPAALRREYELEGLRRDVLEGTRSVPADEEERLFLERALLSALRAGWCAARAPLPQAALAERSRPADSSSQRAR